MDQPDTPVVKRRLVELTGTDMRQAAQRRPVILLPLGSHDDQGPHAPMGDYLSSGSAIRACPRREPGHVWWGSWQPSAPALPPPSPAGTPDGRL